MNMSVKHTNQMFDKKMKAMGDNNNNPDLALQNIEKVVSDMVRLKYDPLEICIAKYRWVKFSDISFIQSTYQGCALCLKYNSITGCKGCPIYLETGEHACRETPYRGLLHACCQKDKLLWDNIISAEHRFLMKIYRKRGGQ